MCHLGTSAVLQGEVLEMLALSGSQGHLVAWEAFSSLRLQGPPPPAPLNLSLQQCRGEENQQLNILDKPGPSSMAQFLAPRHRASVEQGWDQWMLLQEVSMHRDPTLSTAGFLPKLLCALSGRL